MNHIPVIEHNEQKITINQLHITERITALWALSEAALGGVLHAFKIPFTGLFIGGSAVIFITLLALFSQKKGTILKATLIVMIVKALISPHTPVNAYVAVGIQGLMGEFLFRWLKYPRAASISLGIFAMLQSSLQMLIALTVVFGNNLWNSIDLFGNYVLKQFMIDPSTQSAFSLSVLLVSIYVGLHLLMGIAAGIFGPIAAEKIKIELRQKRNMFIPLYEGKNSNISKPKRRRQRFLRLSNIIFIMAVLIIILSYIFPIFEKSQGSAALIMIIRSILIMTIWFTFLGPKVLKRVQKYLYSKQNVYADEVKNIIEVFPVLRQIVNQCWNHSSNYKNIKRIKYFSVLLLTYLLTAEFKYQHSEEITESVTLQ